MTATTPHTDVLLALLGAALVTYGLRLGGLLLSERLPRTAFFKSFLEILPGALLTALVVPGIVAAGPWGGAAALLTALLARKTGNIFWAMLAGVALVALQRNL
jgi:uncharacterized membrane protein